MYFRRCMQLLAVLSIVLFCFFAEVANACDVPVFRYALEFWPASRYRIAVLHRSAPSSRTLELVTELGSFSYKEVSYSNLAVSTFDIEQKVPELVRHFWKEAGEPELPCMIVFYPYDAGIGQPAWLGAFTKGNIARLVNSPVRQKIAEKILEGDSAVWVLLESGNEEKDTDCLVDPEILTPQCRSRTGTAPGTGRDTL